MYKHGTLHHSHTHTQGYNESPASPAVNNAVEKVSLVWNSVYVDQLAWWMVCVYQGCTIFLRDLVHNHTLYTPQVHHPPEHFLLWSASDFKLNPEAHMKQLVRWLGMDAYEINTHVQLSQDIGAVAYLVDTLPPTLHTRLHAVFQQHNMRLFAFLRNKGWGLFAKHLQQQWDKAGRAATQDDGQPPMLYVE